MSEKKDLQKIIGHLSSLPDLSGDDIKACRKALGLSADKFARVLELKGMQAARTVRRYEAGQIKINPMKRMFIADALHKKLQEAASAYFLAIKGLKGAVALPTVIKATGDGKEK